MPTEIERRFLVTSDAWRDSVLSSVRYRQGYLSRGAQSAIRVRTDGETAFLNIKSSVDARYYNSTLSEVPFSQWPRD